MPNVLTAVKKTLSDRRYSAGFIVIAAIVFSLLFWIQVKTVPGNSGRFQIALFDWLDWAVLVAIAVLNALFITIEIHAFNLNRSIAKAGGVGAGLITGGIGTSSSVLASIFSTATCSLCVSAIFGFLGANSVVFLVSNRGYVIMITLLLLLLSLYLSGKRFGRTCNECQIKL
ncbi:MAG: hypothetical protein HYT65_01260 [Candidatus Yanofskybacteria bacterium]|nr:hypothetical protein [Candidatus Yanofskybacteria bacterium]